jgi:hypothetical protein
MWIEGANMVLAKGARKQQPPTMMVARTFFAVGQDWDVKSALSSELEMWTYLRMLLVVFVEYNHVGIKTLQLIPIDEDLVRL